MFVYSLIVLHSSIFMRGLMLHLHVEVNRFNPPVEFLECTLHFFQLHFERQQFLLFLGGKL